MLGSITNRAQTLSPYTRPTNSSTQGGGTSDSFLLTVSDNKSDPKGTNKSTDKSDSYRPGLSVSPGSFNFDLNYNNVDHTQAEFNAHYAEGAKLVSASQGLPDGQYDFSRMSVKQLHIVVNDMIVNKGATPEEYSGLAAMIETNGQDISSVSDRSKDFITILKAERDFHAGLGKSNGTALRDQAALDYIENLGAIKR